MNKKQIEVATPRRSCQYNFFTRLTIRAFSDVEKPFLFSDLAALSFKTLTRTMKP